MIEMESEGRLMKGKESGSGVMWENFTRERRESTHFLQ